MDLLRKKNVDSFEKWIDFQILWIVKKWNFATVPAVLRPPDPLRGRLIAFKLAGHSPRKNSWRSHRKFLNQIMEFTENFSGFIGYHKKWKCKIISRKKFRNSCKINPIFLNFSYKKWIFWGRKMLTFLRNEFIFEYFESF